MRKIFNLLLKIITAPIRLITWPFRKLRDFINYEPEDSSVPDVFAQTIQQPMVLLEHLDAMRKHLFRGLAVLALTTGVSFAFASRIMDFLSRPIGGIEALQSIEVTESLGAFMRVSLLSGFAIAFPYLLFEAFAFINPALKRGERIIILFAVPAAVIFFLSGLYFAYKIMLPVALPFLLNFLDIPTIPRPSNYIRFVTKFLSVPPCDYGSRSCRLCASQVITQRMALCHHRDCNTCCHGYPHNRPCEYGSRHGSDGTSVFPQYCACSNRPTIQIKARGIMIHL
jgi:hypothetical protein